LKRLIGFLVLLVISWPCTFAAEGPSRWRVVWRASQALLAGANAADTATSWGKYESNPLLRTGQRFGYGSMAIKLGILGGGLAAQHFIARKYPNQTPYLATANLAATAVLAAAAAHNMGVPAAR
jgi:hypothetical protein